MELLPRKKLILSVLLCQILTSWAATVSTPKGKIIGSESLTTRNGRKIYSFTGIPYARPPIGELRFKEAIPREPWKEPFDATKDGHDCPQINIFTQQGDMKGRVPYIFGHEDCLIVNVYSPKVDPSANLPVMVFIHGGGFTQGSGRIYGPEFLLDRDIVLVTLNYRLSLFGFLSTGDDVFPANLGMKDQMLALQWVHDNIKNFGGDPNLVTVFGESAGGASTHLNLLSPLNKGLIHRAIAMSGTGFCPWAIMSPQLAKERTKTLAVLSRCPTDPAEEMLKCMQTQPVEKLLETSEKFQDWLLTPAVVFGPTVEAANVTNAFLTTDLSKIESKIPYMTGVNSGEGGLAANLVFTAGGKYEIELKEHPQNVLPKFLTLDGKFAREKVPAVSEKIQNFYFGEKPISKETTQEFINMITDSWFLSGAVESALKYNGDAYVYYYDTPQSVSFNSIFGNGEIKGVSHSDITLSLFPQPHFFPNRTLSEMDEKVIDKMLDIWTDFAKHGKPTEIAKWTPTGKTTNVSKYLHITGGEPLVKENFLPERVEFWQSLDNIQPDKKNIT